MKYAGSRHRIIATDSNKESEGVAVRENIVSANRWGGIRVVYGSRKNTFFQNTVGLNRDRSDTLGNGTGGGNYGGFFVDSGSDSNVFVDNWIGGIASDQPLVQGIERPVIEESDGTAVSVTAGAGQTVDMFNDEKNEGRIYLGTGVADGSGHFSLVLPGPTPLPFITATATDLDGSTSGFSQPFTASSAVQAMTARPAMNYLSPNYPNPFNPSTTLRFGVSRPGRVRITVWNEKGERAAILTDGRFETNGFFEARKIALVR